MILYKSLEQCNNENEKINIIIKVRTEFDKAKRLSLGTIKEVVKKIKKPLSSAVLKKKVAQDIVKLINEEKYNE